MESDSEVLLYTVVTAASIAFYLLLTFYGVKALSTWLIPDFYNAMSGSDVRAWHASFSSTVNAVILTYGSFHILWFENLWEDIFWHDSPRLRTLSCTGIGYFISDIILLLVYEGNPAKRQYMLHHGICIVGYAMTTAYKTLAFFTCLRGLAEFSTPFMNMRWALATWKLKEKRIYLINGFLFLFSFFAGRIVTIPVFYYKVIPEIGSEGFRRLNLSCQVIFFGATFCLDCLNIKWFRVVCKGFLKGMRERYSTEQKKDE